MHKKLRGGIMFPCTVVLYYDHYHYYCYYYHDHYYYYCRYRQP